VAFFVCDTQTFLRESAPTIGPFDFVFIDADHSAEAARGDLLGVFPHVSEHGLILLHDTFPGTQADTDPGLCGGVWQIAEHPPDLQAEILTVPFHPGLTLIRKRTRHLPW
jgi:predicted O-methyltransferase YrrM